MVRLRRQTITVSTTCPRGTRVGTRLKSGVRHHFTGSPTVTTTWFTANRGGTRVFFCRRHIDGVRVINSGARVTIVGRHIHRHFQHNTSVSGRHQTVKGLLHRFTNSTLFFFNLNNLTVIPQHIGQAKERHHATVIARSRILLHRLVRITTGDLQTSKRVLCRLFDASVALLFGRFSGAIIALYLFRLWVPKVVFIFTR